MNKSSKLYITLIVLAIISMVVLEYTKPKEVNWFPSYAKHHKIPYGTYIFHDQLERLFSKDMIIDVDRPPFEYLNTNDTISGTYVFINNQLGFDEAELNRLLEWTDKGNTLFLASESFGDKLLDTLHTSISILNNLESNYQLQLKNKNLRNDSLYDYDQTFNIPYFSEVDTTQVSTISTIDFQTNSTNSEDNQHINTIRHKFGDGTIILSTFPQAFTNFFILQDPNQNFTAGLLSYLNSDLPIYVDNHYKSGKKFYSSPLYVMLNNKVLRWAYYTMLIGVLIFVIFDGKRKQRAIPIINPLKNQTAEFTRTIANMYYEKGKHQEIAQHKIQYFLDYIRSHFHLNTSKLDEKFIEHLAARSNNSITDTEKLFSIIKTISQKTQINSKDLEKLNTLIESFKSKNLWKTKTT